MGELAIFSLNDIYYLLASVACTCMYFDALDVDAIMIFMCICVTLVTVICVLHLRDSSSFPPGPPRYPIIQGVRQATVILTPPFSLAWVDRSSSYLR